MQPDVGGGGRLMPRAHLLVSVDMVEGLEVFEPGFVPATRLSALEAARLELAGAVAHRQGILEALGALQAAGEGEAMGPLISRLVLVDQAATDVVGRVSMVVHQNRALLSEWAGLASTADAVALWRLLDVFAKPTAPLQAMRRAVEDARSGWWRAAREVGDGVA